MTVCEDWAVNRCRGDIHWMWQKVFWIKNHLELLTLPLSTGSQGAVEALRNACQSGSPRYVKKQLSELILLTQLLTMKQLFWFIIVIVVLINSFSFHCTFCVFYVTFTSGSTQVNLHTWLLFFKIFFFFFVPSNMANALANAMCERCKSGFAPAEKIVNSNGELYHEQCFVCAQCFQQFPEGLFYEVTCCISFN